MTISVTKRYLRITHSSDGTMKRDYYNLPGDMVDIVKHDVSISMPACMDQKEAARVLRQAADELETLT